MRLWLLLSFVLLASCEDDASFEPEIVTPGEDVLGRIPCTEGLAGVYPCDGYDVLARIPLSAIGGTALNDVWGWTDPDTSKEYALVGSTNKTTFIDITDAENPQIIGALPTATTSILWRDIKVYQNHAFIVSEAPDHGMQVFDLTRLRNPEENPVIYDADAHYTAFGNAHNIVINESSGFAYAVGTETFSGGPHFINIQNPTSPQSVGGFDAAGYTHDAQVVTYNGPDADYSGKEIFIGSNEDQVVIADVTDKENPLLISTVSHTNVGYTHQGWFDEAHRFFYVNDENDETAFGLNTRTLLFDLTDLDTPQYTGPYFGSSQAIDHNLYVHNDQLFLSNYTAGMRVIDLTNPTPDGLFDIGFFDTFPANDATSIDGVWSVYPYFTSGNILISDMSNGLFIVHKSNT